MKKRLCQSDPPGLACTVSVALLLKFLFSCNRRLIEGVASASLSCVLKGAPSTSSPIVQSFEAADVVVSLKQ